MRGFQASGPHAEGHAAVARAIGFIGECLVRAGGPVRPSVSSRRGLSRVDRSAARSSPGWALSRQPPRPRVDAGSRIKRAVPTGLTKSVGFSSATRSGSPLRRCRENVRRHPLSALRPHKIRSRHRPILPGSSVAKRSTCRVPAVLVSPPSCLMGADSIGPGQIAAPSGRFPQRRDRASLRRPGRILL